jgi:hypothetical protein
MRQRLARLDRVADVKQIARGKCVKPYTRGPPMTREIRPSAQPRKGRHARVWQCENLAGSRAWQPNRRECVRCTLWPPGLKA